MTSEYRAPGYTEVRELGAGAQGRVVLAREEASGDLVAIKYLRAGGTEQARATLRKEAELLSRLADPHVAGLRAVLETADDVAIVMEAVEGHPLRLILDERRTLEPAAALSVLKGSVLGLAAAHAVGVVHRDYKPANVLVQADGQSKLIDFGIAVLTGQGDASGTPPYMAPEQWEGGPASPATDIYAATCVFFECVTGRRPFGGDLRGMRTAHLTAPVPDGDVPEPLRPLVIRGMAKDPSRRLWDATAFVAELESIAVAAYGPDWEHRGWLALGAAASGLAVLFPVAVATGVVGGSGAAGTGAGGLTAAQATAEATASKGGVLAKVGGVKGATAITAAGTGVIVAAALLWPTGPGPGGIARGSVRADFTRPGALLGFPGMPAAETPYMQIDFTATPSRIRPGTTVKLTARFRARFVWGVKYLEDGTRQCFGEKSKRRDRNRGYGFTFASADAPQNRVWFYRVRSKSAKLPGGPGIFVTASWRKSEESQPYNLADCAYNSTWLITYDAKVPDTDELPPGRYLVSPYSPLRFTSLRSAGRSVSLDAAGARAQGSVPMIRILG